MGDWVGPLVESYGILAIGIGILLECMGLPLPGETLLVIGSGLAGTGDLPLWELVVVAITAATVGDNIGYLVGRLAGRPLILRHGSRIGITHERFAKVEGIIERRGFIIVLVARFIVLLRQLNGLAAGTAKMHWIKFFVANFAGACLWVSFWATLGYHLGPAAEEIIPHVIRWIVAHIAVILPVVLVVVLAVLWIMRRRRAARLALAGGNLDDQRDLG
ncbi:DedA family protein [Maritimibacter sp. DP1N21-5]|uniref:DedA family protein n=1 Tax=Maritimibacter sp. DP1N21-5 TaxID=2836867 RepID=UPI001C48D7B9|nr:DedA family protein [Maritimibacter sp. DP1N21-5]MBV7410755.1 DedA family protein [Maritimibacter sp. DP1N21-5]